MADVISFYRGVEVLRGDGALLDIMVRQEQLQKATRNATRSQFLAPAFVDELEAKFPGLTAGSDECRDRFDDEAELENDDDEEWARISGLAGVEADDGGL